MRSTRITITGPIAMLLSLAVIVLGGTHLFAGHGSNLGGYGTNFSPAVLTGQVSDARGHPVSAAIVSTIAGHATITDDSGHYMLMIDAPGIYTVKASKGALAKTERIEVALGTTAMLNLTLRRGPRP